MNPSVPVVVHLRLDGMMSNGLQYKTTDVGPYVANLQVHAS